MNLVEILFIAIGLGMDALSVALCKGMTMQNMNWKKAMIIGAYFGIFQGVMPIIGFFVGINFDNLIESISHWIALMLLIVIGMNMILDNFKEDKNNINDKVDFKTMIGLAIATSIDALIIGITFSILQVKIFITSIIIGIVTFVMSVIGVKVGNIFGKKMGKGATIFGGVVLILIGIKIVIEHYI